MRIFSDQNVPIIVSCVMSLIAMEYIHKKKILNHIKFLASLFELRIDEEGLFFGQKEAGKESYLIAANIVNFQPFIIVGIKTKKIFLGKYFITWSVCVDNSVTTTLKMCFYIPFFFTIKLCEIKFLISCF